MRGRLARARHRLSGGRLQHRLGLRARRAPRALSGIAGHRSHRARRRGRRRRVRLAAHRGDRAPKARSTAAPTRPRFADAVAPPACCRAHVRCSWRLPKRGGPAGPSPKPSRIAISIPCFRRADAPDTLVLGCTHFPILVDAIRAVLPPHVRIVDSAATTARTLAGRMAPRATRRGAIARPGNTAIEGAVDHGWRPTMRSASRASAADSSAKALSAEAVEIIDL